MFNSKNSIGYKNPIPGIKMKTLCHGRNTLMTEVILEKGSVLPAHSHPHEQTGYLVSGKMTLFINGKAHETGPGDSWCVPGDVEHGAEIHEDSVAVEIFSPVREEYLP